ncbi:MAG: hypothetical protein JRD89_02075 [Deltaproteobacteria bacterium]|nr:hypothetical protein [Deltaproteobacteria bacterium]
MADDFLKDTIDQLKAQDREKARQEILAKIADRFKGFGGDHLMDYWIKHVEGRAVELLTDEEHAALTANKMSAWSGEAVILRAFVIHLCGAYGVEPEDLEE